MPTLNWIGKEAVINHDKEVPFRLLKKVKSSSIGNNSKNLIIHGDNLEALKALMPYYKSKIKCIYIDPPYNTGNENWVYNDKVNSPKIRKWLGRVVGREAEDLCRHDKWLCMMYPRLKLLKELLSLEGAIFISIDDNEVSRLRQILDEIFGIGNFMAQFCWRKTDNQANIGNIANVKEYILCYAKDRSSVSFKKIGLSERARKEYRYKDERGEFRRDIIFHKTRGRHYYNVKTTSGNILKGPWMIPEERFKEKLEKNEIYWASGKMETPYGKLYLKNSTGQIISDLLGIEYGTNQQASVELRSLFGKRVFDFPKPTSLIKTFITLLCEKNDLVLDSFAGTGTTGHAVLKFNKENNQDLNFIMVEMEDNITKKITVERIKRAIKKYKYKEGFEFCELDKPLFNEEGQIEKECSFEQLATYIYFSETQTNINKKKIKFPFLGGYLDTEYYLIFKRKNHNLLQGKTLKLLNKNNKKKVIYADQCLLSDEFMEKNNLIFKQIPYEIEK